MFDVTTDTMAEIFNSQCIVIGVDSANKPTIINLLGDHIDVGELQAHLDAIPALGFGKTTLNYNSDNNVPIFLCVGVGDDPLPTKKYIKLMEAVATRISEEKFETVSILLHGVEKEGVNIAYVTLTALNDELYALNNFKSKPKGSRLERVSFLGGRISEPDVNYAMNVCRGINLAKDLGNTPPNVCTPEYLEVSAMDIVEGNDTTSLNVLGETELTNLNMRALLSVNAGSSKPPRLIEISYETTNPIMTVVLIGKAVTFDSGGLSLKPAKSMELMKFDMCGGGCVMGVMEAIKNMNLRVDVIGLIPAVENMVNANSTKPGDIITSMSGKTIEILNTDAEGRLILCDTITYCEKFKPDVVIDVATLTGAVVGALGNKHSGIFSDDAVLIDELISTGDMVGDTLWPLPMEDEYDKLLESEFADFANSGVGVGASTAAGFLRRFVTNSYVWAHIDVAGTAWSKKRATGRPVKLLVEYLKNL